MVYYIYEFLKRCKNDLKWRKVYIFVRNKCIIGILVMINIIIWGFVLWKKIESGDIEVNNIIDVLKLKINEFLN